MLDRTLIIKELGLEDLDQEMQERTLSELEAKIMTAINNAALSSLSEAEKITYQDEVQAQDILTTKLTDSFLQTITSQVVAEFKANQRG